MDLVPLDSAAEAHHVGNARQAAEEPLQGPVLQRFQVVEVVDRAAQGIQEATVMVPGGFIEVLRCRLDDGSKIAGGAAGLTTGTILGA